MKEKLNNLTHTARTILIIAGAIVVALLLWQIIAFTLGIIGTIIKIAALAAVLYLLYLIVRATIGRRDSDRKGTSIFS